MRWWRGTLWSGKLVDLLTSRKSYVDANLAKLYGVTAMGATDTNFVPVEYTQGQRIGREFFERRRQAACHAAQRGIDHHALLALAQADVRDIKARAGEETAQRMIEQRPERGGLRFAARHELECAARTRAADHVYRSAEDLAARFTHREARFGERELAACLLERRQGAQQHHIIACEFIFARDFACLQLGER